MNQQVETIIVGGGQSGLAVSYKLSESSQEHIILERGKIANTWREERWDNFRLVFPNRYWRMLGMVYDGNEPDAFMGKSEIINRFEKYVYKVKPPLHLGVNVLKVSAGGALRYKVITTEGVYHCNNLVVATGPSQSPRIPDWSSSISSDIFQIHSKAYRNPSQLPEGAILIVGSGQSGVQIAEDLMNSGREIYLCIGSCGWLPRRYLGKDISDWLVILGVLDRPIDTFASLKEAQASAIPQVIGDERGGHDLNIHTLEEQGVSLLGRAVNGIGNIIHLEELEQNIEKSDNYSYNAKKNDR